MSSSQYQKKLDLLLEYMGQAETEVQNGKTDKIKPSLLLHACCGPCSSYVLEYLTSFFDITILYYNPNIYPEAEYFRRLNELKNLLPRFPAALENKVKLVEDTYNPDDFYRAIGIKENPELADEEEKGERCRRCYEFRLKRAYEYAAKNKFDYFCTTLSISPFKDAEKINIIGQKLEKESDSVYEGLEEESEGKLSLGAQREEKKIEGPRWLPSDFKKKGGFKRSLELSAEYGLYRQQYCGCVYSKKNTEKAREKYGLSEK
ncbi:MAG: epoxyqueuosine reductase QueH [Treponema sp.]|nr:epoxyqueuosine reductase QueH [Treponema sp.]